MRAVVAMIAGPIALMPLSPFGGDTLGQIAETYGTRASKIRRWNNMKYGSHLIHPGQRLVIWVK